MSQPFKLYRLQQIDSHLDHLRAKLRETEIALNDAKEVQRAEASRIETEKNLQKARKTLRTVEEEVKAVQFKLEQTESTLYGGKVRNPKELQDLQKENAALKRQINTMEDHQLEEMLAVEEAEKANRQAIVFFEDVQKKDAAQKKGLVELKASQVKEIERLESERLATSSAVSPEDLQVYEQIRKQKRGVAVAKVSENACSACGSTLTPSQVQAASSPSQLSRCSFCGRILYTG